MLLELGKGFVSVYSFNEAEEEEISKIKVYGCLVYALKSTSAKHLSHGPKTTQTWYTQLQSVENTVFKMQGATNLNVGGYQVELTIHALNFEDAVSIALQSGYLHNSLAKLHLNTILISPANCFEYVLKIVNLTHFTPAAESTLTKRPATTVCAPSTKHCE